MIERQLHTSILALSLAAIGCGSTPAAEIRTTTSLPRSGSEQRNEPTQARSGGDTNGSRPQTCTMSAVYFGFDSAELTSNAREALARQATCVATGIPLVLRGATDPRGTEEYNLALGERRAQAVAQYLRSLGVPTDRVRASSVGEEMARGQDESSWAMDRWVRSDN